MTRPHPEPARLLRAGAAFLWLATGLLVALPYYREVGAQYLARLGLPDWLMFAACALEVGLGLRVLLGRAAAWVTALQVGMVAFFTAVLAWDDPRLLVHPFGMLTKNVPFVAVVLAAFLVEREGWTARATWLLRAGIAAIWLTEGIFPKVFFQSEFERQVVARSGLVHGDPGGFLVFMGLCQAASGVLALALSGRPLRWVLLLQALGLTVLPVLVAWDEPQWWVHPFGPLTKNVPILAGTAVLVLRLCPPVFLSARWERIALLTFAVPREVVAPYLPPGVEPDERDGRALVSLVALDMRRVRVLGVPCPGPLGSFSEVNLRVVARRCHAGGGGSAAAAHQRETEGDRGVVFVRELVPSRLVAWVARALFGEPFDAAAIETTSRRDGGTVTVERRVTRGGRTYTLTVEASGDPVVPAPGSEAHFLVERYLGFSRHGTVRVEHPPWAAYPVARATLDLDWAALYGQAWAVLAGAAPVSVVLTDGSDARVLAG